MARGSRSNRERPTIATPNYWGSLPPKNINLLLDRAKTHKSHLAVEGLIAHFLFPGAAYSPSLNAVFLSVFPEGFGILILHVYIQGTGAALPGVEGLCSDGLVSE